jgi:hypothetical protein
MGLGTPIHYRGFRLSQERHLGWRVEPLTRRNQPSPDGAFDTPPSSLADVKALIDWRLDQAA